MNRISKQSIGLACVLAALSVSTLACNPPRPRDPSEPRRSGLRTPPALPPPSKAGAEMFSAVAIDDLEDQETVHYFARRKDGGMLVLARGGRFMARATAADGTPKSPQATDVGAAPSGNAELVLGALRPAGDGYELVWAEREGGRTKLATLALDAAGAARGARVNVAEISDEVSFIDVIPREGGSLVVWETSRGQLVDVSGVALNPQGGLAGGVTALLGGALAWHSAPSGGVLAAVMPGESKDEGDNGSVPTGKVALVTLDAAGKPRAQVIVSAEATAQPDVVITEIGGRMVLAWTDVREIDAAVWTAVIDQKGAIVTPPQRATPPTGEQALVATAGGEAGGPTIERGLIAWEDVLRAPPESRQIHLATFGADGKLGKERALVAFHADGTPPDLSADPSGFGVVTLAPAWQGGAPPEDAPVWPTFVRFGRDLSVLSAEPVRAATFGSDGVPYLVHGLSCAAGTCTTVASGGEAPAKVGIVSLASRKTEWFAPARREPDDAPPRAVTLSALYNGEQISRVAAADIPGGGSLTAWVTYFTEADSGPVAKRSGGAEISLVALSADGKAAAPINLSKKAVSIGGVALAPAIGDKKEIAIAWVAREKGESQVYVTKVDETGKKLAQKKITVVPRVKKGAAWTEASDVAIAWTSGEGGEGWVVSWVDTRDGNAEVYVAKVDRALTKTVPDRRITDAPGDAAEVHMLARGKELLLAWSDARQKPEEGKGDIYVARLETKSLTKLGTESRLAATPEHSRSPQLVAGPGGAVWAAWVEDAGEGTGAGGAVRFSVLDDKGAATTTTTLAGAAGRTIVSATFACGDKACRGVVAKAAGDALLLEAFELSQTALAGPQKTLLTLPGTGSADISPVFADRAGQSLFFGADGSSGTGRVRRMKIDW